jgi:hypothetical protein
MCCSTGVCGPEVGPNLGQFAGDLDWLEEHGVKVERIDLAQEPKAVTSSCCGGTQSIPDKSPGCC